MRFFKIFAMLMGFICLAASSRALAAEADMQAFRDVYLQNMGEAKGYHLELMFNGPTLQSNVIADGQLWNNGAAVAEGRMSWDYTDLAAGQTKRTEMPFYAERSGNVVVLYGKRGGQWKKENILGGFTWLLNAVSSDDRETKMKYAATVKDVKLEDAGKGQQRMQVTFDGKELSAVEDKAVRESIAAMSEADSRDAMATVVYLNAALAASDLKITWTVDKKTGETVWEHKAPYAWSSPACVYSEDGSGAVFYAVSSGKMYLLDGVTGEELSSLAVTDGTIEASPAVYEDRVVIGTRGQSIRGLVLK